MYAIDLFETPGTPEQDPRPQSAYVPVNPEKPGARNRALGNANLAILMKSINNVDMNSRPAPLPAKLNFLDGRSYTIEPKYYPALIGYYRNLSDVERVNFIYRTLVSYNKTIKFLNTLSQGTLFEKEEKKSSKYKDVAVQRAMRQAVADFPSADSDTEAFAKSMMVQQDQDQKNINRLKSASQRNQELINKNDKLDQTQARSIDAIQREIDKVEKDNDSLTQMVQQMSRANAELQSTLDRMKQKKPSAEPAVTPVTKPQVGVSVATDKIPAQATVGGEPAEILPSSPIDIGARQQINDLSKSVTGALLQLKDKEQAQGLTPVEQERVEKLEKRLAQIEKAQSVFKGFKSKQDKKAQQAGNAAISAIAKAMGGGTTDADVKAVEPTNIQAAPKIEPHATSDEKKSNVLKFVPRDLTGADVAAGNQDSKEQPDLFAAEDLTHGLEEAEVIPTKQVLQGYVVEFNPRTNVITISQRGQALKQIKLKLATRRGYEQLVNKFIHSQEDEKYPDDIEDRDVRLPMRKVAEGSVFGQQDFDTQMDLAKLKSQLTQPKAAQSAPASTAQPVSYQPPARLSDLQARHQRVKALTKIKGEIEDMQQKATKGGRMLPRGLAADLEDYFTTADIDTAYDDMMAKYQKQLAALQQYLGMRKALWSPKKDVHEMRAREIEESKSEVWTVHFTDGTAVRYCASDETDPAAVRKQYANKGKTVAKFDYGFGVDQPAGPGPEAHEPGSGRAVSARTGETLPEDTMSEFKAAALAKIKKALANPKLDPTTRKDYETRLHKLQALEEGNVIPVDFRQGAGSEDLVAFKNTRGDYFDKIARASQAGDVESVKRLRVELKDLEDAARRRGLIK